MKALLLALSVLLASCSITLKPEFTAIGSIAQVRTNPPIVKTAAEVQLFYASSPPGFSLRDNELTIEPGYGHRILGILKLRRAGGNKCYVVQGDAIAALQRGGYENGANAVVYATTPLAKEEGIEACQLANVAGEFGSGWAVVLGEAPRSPAAEPAAPTAPTPASTPAPAPAPATPAASTH